jgi:broad specificity phosphatase PhoE
LGRKREKVLLGVLLQQASQALAMQPVLKGGNVVIITHGGGIGVLLSRALATQVRLARSAFAVLIVIVAVYVGWKAASALGWTG